VTTTDIVRPGPMSEQWRQLIELMAPGAQPWEIDYTRQVSAALDLSIFANPPEVAIIGRFDSRVGRVVYRPQVTVDGRLALAVRSGRVVGLEGPHFTGPRDQWTNDRGERQWIDVWDCKDEGAYPRAARYLIHVAGYTFPVNGTAPWLEFCQRDKNGKLQPLWQRMPTTMLAKTALSLGLRRSGIEKLPPDIPVDYEGDGPVLAGPSAGETPAPAVEELPPVPSGRGGPNLTAEHVLTGASRRDGILQCSCGDTFATAWAFNVHKKDMRGEPPDDVYDTSPESQGYDDDLQPASYEDPAYEDDYPGRPFGND
jgi:hypothetical protein